MRLIAWSSNRTVMKICSSKDYHETTANKDIIRMFQYPADLVTLTEEILNRKLHFLCSVRHDLLILVIGMFQFFVSEFVFDKV